MELACDWNLAQARKEKTVLELGLEWSPEFSPSHRKGSAVLMLQTALEQHGKPPGEKKKQSLLQGVILKMRDVWDFRQPQLPRGRPTVTNAILQVTVLVNESHCSNLHESEIIIFLLHQHW